MRSSIARSICRNFNDLGGLKFSVWSSSCIVKAHGTHLSLGSTSLPGSSLMIIGNSSHEEARSGNWIHKGALMGFVLTGAVVLKKTVNAAEAKPQTISIIDKAEEIKVIGEADILYSQNQTDSLYEFLKRYETISSPEICWRLARASCDKAKHCDPKSKEREILMREGFEHAKRGVEQDDQCGPCHKWYAVMLNYVGDYEGNKQKITYSYIVKEHFMKAIALNPKDATSMYCLGQWCYFFADMSWYTQKIAALIFGTPPTSTFQEALEFFLMAEHTDPNFYSMNHLMLARTYLKLNDKTKAKEHLLMARDLPVKSPDDRQAHAESIELLNQL